MSTENSTATAIANSKSAASSILSSMTAEHAVKPQAHMQSAAAAPKAESDACCHSVSEASPAVTIGAPRAREAASVTPAASHRCTAHKSGDVVQSHMKELESPDAARRAAAAVALGKSADCAAAAPLIGALRDADADVAREAAAALGILGDASAVEPLIAVLANADGYYHPVVRVAATVSLGQLHDLRAFEPLVQAINDPIAEASAEAIRSLAILADARGVAPLIAVMRNEQGFFLPTTRDAAVVGLGKLGGTQAEFELRFISTNPWEDAVIREAAIEALGANSPAVAAH